MSVPQLETATRRTEATDSGRFFVGGVEIRVSRFVLGIIGDLDETRVKSEEARGQLSSITAAEDAACQAYSKGNTSPDIVAAAARVYSLTDLAGLYPDREAAVRNEGSRVASQIAKALHTPELINIGGISYWTVPNRLGQAVLLTSHDGDRAFTFGETPFELDFPDVGVAQIGHHVSLLTGIAASDQMTQAQA